MNGQDLIARQLAGVPVDVSLIDTLPEPVRAIAQRVASANGEGPLGAFERAVSECIMDARERDAFRRGVFAVDPTAPEQRNLTDLGNAERFAARHGEHVKHVPAWGWLAWDSTRWARDEGAAIRHAKETVRAMYAEAAQITDETNRKRLADHAIRSENAARLDALLKLAETEKQVEARAADFDGEPLLLNCANGTLDLRTGQLHPHNPADRLTRITGTLYDPAATCPTWDAFLDRVLGGSRELVEFVQRAMGYTLTGDTSGQCLFFCYGTGANGKSTFLETVRAVLGEYSQQSEFSTFLARQNESVRNDIARMAGVRFVAAIEAGEGRRLNEPLIKTLTGGDTVTARFLFKDYFEFRPQFKLWLAANHKPIIRGTDNAIWRRIRLIPFTVTIPESERDPRLAMKLRAELPGILAWAVRGCLDWQRAGLGTPTEVRNATESYRAEMDTLAAFIDEHCFVGPAATVKKGDLYSAYKAWAEGNGEYVETSRAFSVRLSERGFPDDRGTGGTRVWRGIGLLAQDRGNQ
jgi:putative DNA primase/helicase